MKPQTPEVSIIVPEGEVFSDIRVCLQMKSHATRVRVFHFGLLFCDPWYRFQSSSYVYYSWNFSSQHNISVSVFTCHQYIHKRSNYQYKHLTIRLQPTGSQRVGHNWSDSTHAWSTTGEGNGNPLQYYCLQNPVDKGAWWAVVHRVAQSQTRMKWLSSSSSMVYYMGFPGGSESKKSACNAGDQGSILGSGRFLEKGIATHSNILAGKSHGQRSLVGYSSLGCTELLVAHDWGLLQLYLSVFSM